MKETVKIIEKRSNTKNLNERLSNKEREDKNDDQVDRDSKRERKMSGNLQERKGGKIICFPDFFEEKEAKGKV